MRAIRPVTEMATSVDSVGMGRRAGSSSERTSSVPAVAWAGTIGVPRAGSVAKRASAGASPARKNPQQRQNYRRKRAWEHLGRWETGKKPRLGHRLAQAVANESGHHLLATLGRHHYHQVQLAAILAPDLGRLAGQAALLGPAEETAAGAAVVVDRPAVG